VKKDLIARAFEASQLEDVKAHTFRRNREAKHTRTKLKNAKIPSNTPNGVFRRRPTERGQRRDLQQPKEATRKKTPEETPAGETGSPNLWLMAA
jgi:hypothetical protein